MFFINEMRLLKGDPFKINDKLSVKHPTLEEITDLDQNINRDSLTEEQLTYSGEQLYFEIVSLFCARPYDYMVELDDNGINWCDKENYDIFIMVYNQERYSEMLNWLFMGKFFFQHAKNSETEELVLYDPVNDIIIDKLAFDQISSFLKRINFQSDTTEFNPANETARQMVIEEKRKELKRMRNRPPKNESQLSTLISFLAWNNSSGMGYDDIFQLRLYRFHDGIRRLLKTEHYRNIMFGYYTGNISGKDIKFDVIDWTGKTTVE